MVDASLVIHKPRVTDRVIAAAVSKQDRSRYVVRVPDAQIIEVDPASTSTRVLAPSGEWATTVRSIDRRVSRALGAWTETHNIVDGALMPSICPAGGSVYFTLKNQPDTGRESVSTVCDITAELSDIKRGSKDDRYRLVWRVMEAEFKGRIEGGEDDDDELAEDEESRCASSTAADYPGDADGAADDQGAADDHGAADEEGKAAEATAADATAEHGATAADHGETAEHLKETDLHDITAQLQSIVRALQKVPR